MVRLILVPRLQRKERYRRYLLKKEIRSRMEQPQTISFYFLYYPTRKSVYPKKGLFDIIVDRGITSGRDLDYLVRGTIERAKGRRRMLPADTNYAVYKSFMDAFARFKTIYKVVEYDFTDPSPPPFGRRHRWKMGVKTRRWF